MKIFYLTLQLQPTNPLYVPVILHAGTLNGKGGCNRVQHNHKHTAENYICIPLYTRVQVLSLRVYDTKLPFELNKKLCFRYQCKGEKKKSRFIFKSIGYIHRILYDSKTSWITSFILQVLPCHIMKLQYGINLNSCQD